MSDQPRTKEQIIEALRATKSGEEWKAECDRIKREHSGLYPDWWYAEVLAKTGNVMAETKAGWL